jgi:hypothetical protein
MAISIYDAAVAGYLQTLPAVAAYLDKGAAHYAASGGDVNELVATRLYPDMLPLAFQIASVQHHSLHAIEACMTTGVFTPPGPLPADIDYAGLQTMIVDTLAALRALTPEAVNAVEGKDVVFQFGEMKMPFTAEGFLLSFSIPNFHFHATTAYDILRSKGVKLGKRDYMGKLRMKA